MAAARCRLESVMSFFGLRSRSTWVRLVLRSVAIRFLDIFCFFMASSSCQATTSLTACACASSKMPSCFRKSSMLEPIWFLRRLCFLLIVSFLESSHDHLTRDDRKPLQKVFECFSTLQIVEQRLDRHARTAKHRSSTKNIRIFDNDSHALIVSRGW